MRRVLLWVAAVALVAAVLLVAFYFAAAFDADRSASASALPRTLEVPAPARPALNGQVTQETINDTICKSGWAREVRSKASSWLRKKKRELLLQREGYHWIGAGALFQLDHIVPIELGGAAEDDSNVVLQPIGEAACKDGVEHCLSAKVCSKGDHHLPLDEAQKAIIGDWRQAKATYCAHTKPCLRLPQAD
jgi:hypothetical protein